MGDFTNNKDGIGQIYKDGSIASAWQDLEPLITPEDLVDLHLPGIPLVSSAIDPFTGKPYIFTPDRLKKQIKRAVPIAELESKIDFMPVQYQETHPFDRCTYESLGYFQLKHRPVGSIQQMQVVAANRSVVWTVPLEWVHVGYLHQGQINLIPLVLSMSGASPSSINVQAGTAGSAFMTAWGNRSWIAGFFEIVFSTGFPNGLFPSVVNELIGTIAAMEILSGLAATNSQTNSSSLGLDGLSQSISTPGPNRYSMRLQELGAKRQWLISRLQANTNTNFICDNV